jgi:hypothetical protein
MYRCDVDESPKLEMSFQLILTANVSSSLIRHPDDGGDTFFRNLGSYKSHKLSHPQIRHSVCNLSYTATNLGVVRI